MPAPALYLFDIDGTLISSPRRAGRRALERACAEVCGIEGALAGIVLHGNTDPCIIDEAFLAHRGRPAAAEEREAVLQAYLRWLAVELEHPQAVCVLPAVAEALAAVAAHGALLGLATGNIEAGAQLKLGRAGLWHHFPFGGFGSDAPERAHLVAVAIQRAEAVAQTALDRAAIWVVGDTPRDVAAAHAAGVRAIAVATGMHDVGVLQRSGAEHVFDTLAGLVAMLLQ